jgi:hypothetical protein
LPSWSDLLISALLPVIDEALLRSSSLHLLTCRSATLTPFYQLLWTLAATASA